MACGERTRLACSVWRLAKHACTPGHSKADREKVESRDFMDKNTGFMKALKCRECGREYPLTATHVCEFDFGPLEVAYDYPRIRQTLTHKQIESRPRTMWRYRELLPIAGEPTVGFQVGFTPIVKADRLARRLGIRELWIKNDAANYPKLPSNN